MLRGFSLLLVLLFCIGVGSCGKTEYVHVGPNWEALSKVEPPSEAFRVWLDAKSKVSVGERLQLRARSDKAGRLWVVSVDSSDELELIFPNDNAPDNEIEAGKELKIPRDEDSWGFAASEPTGPNLLAAIVTTGDTDLGEVLQLEKSAPKALVLVDEDPAWGIARRVIEVQGE